MSKFWKNALHFALIAANGVVAAKYPALAPYIGPVLAAGNAALESPISK